jgi:hypothetical protein
VKWIRGALIKLKKFIFVWLVIGAIGASARAESYVVQPDDILGTISMKLFGSARFSRKLASWNGLEWNGVIRAGMVLRVPPELEARRIAARAGDKLVLEMWRRRLGALAEEQRIEPNRIANRNPTSAVQVAPVSSEDAQMRAQALLGTGGQARLDEIEVLVRDHPSYCSLKYVRAAIKRLKMETGRSACPDIDSKP